MIKALMSTMEATMKKSAEGFRSELASLRSGRASMALLENVRVEYYGSMLPINQVANLSIPEARTIEIKPWDISALPAIDKAILKSDLGVTPMNDGKIIRLTIPKLNEDTRKELVKNVKKIAEEFRISIRTARHDAVEALKKAEKDKIASEDVRKTTEHEIQKITDSFIKLIDDTLQHKEKEIMEV